jgi:Ser/Thr protein kinase RdoA (MazF antagonist)
MADDPKAAYTPVAFDALHQFGIEPDELELVTVSENVTFKAIARNRAYVLRLHRPGYHDLAELESERLWIRALASHGIDVPSPVPASDGREYVRVHIPATSEDRYAGLAHWTDGDVLFDVLEGLDNAPAVEDYFGQLGNLVAAMHDQAATWAIPASFKRHSLDHDGLLGPRPFWGPFWEHPVFSADERRLVTRTRDHVRAMLVRFGKDRASFSLIHADLHAGNVVVHDDRLMVIDFDDAGFGWHAYDIAVALGHQRWHPLFRAMQPAFVEGYRRRRALPDNVLALVPTFLMVRDMAIIGWIGQRPELGRKDVTAIKDRVCAQCERYLSEMT